MEFIGINSLDELSLFVGLFRRVLMHAFAERTAHGLGQENSGVAELIAQFVCGGKSARPALFVTTFTQQIHLRRLVFKIGSLHPQQADSTATLPVVMKQL